jgi:hypothetical protein
MSQSQGIIRRHSNVSYGKTIVYGMNLHCVMLIQALWYPKITKTMQCGTHDFSSEAIVEMHCNMYWKNFQQIVFENQK